MSPVRRFGNRADPAGGHSGFDAASSNGLRALPQPLHLLEYTFGTGHYHLGLFDTVDEAICIAQDRTSSVAAESLQHAEQVLDIGCGLGGTTRLLACRAKSVTALDPAAAAIEFARCKAIPPGGPHDLGFVHATLHEFAASAPQRFSGAVAIEVLQHFPSLDEFFADCRGLLERGARLAVHDVCSDANQSFERVPFHRRGEVPARAAAAGFALIHRHDESGRAVPTFDHFARGLDVRRSGLIEFYGGDDRRFRARVEQQLDDLLGHIDALRRAFHCGDLGYETLVFERQ